MPFLHLGSRSKRLRCLLPCSLLLLQRRVRACNLLQWRHQLSQQPQTLLQRRPLLRHQLRLPLQRNRSVSQSSLMPRRCLLRRSRRKRLRRLMSLPTRLLQAHPPQQAQQSGLLPHVRRSLRLATWAERS